MSNCPICSMPMKKETREIKKDIFAQVEVCQKCKDEWIDEKGYEALYEVFTGVPSGASSISSKDTRHFIKCSPDRHSK